MTERRTVSSSDSRELTAPGTCCATPGRRFLRALLAPGYRPHLPSLAPVQLANLRLDRIGIEPPLTKPHGHLVIGGSQAQEDVFGGQFQRLGEQASRSQARLNQTVPPRSRTACYLHPLAVWRISLCPSVGPSLADYAGMSIASLPASRPHDTPAPMSNPTNSSCTLQLVTAGAIGPARSVNQGTFGGGGETVLPYPLVWQIGNTSAILTPDGAFCCLDSPCFGSYNSVAAL